MTTASRSFGRSLKPTPNALSPKSNPPMASAPTQCQPLPSGPETTLESLTDELLQPPTQPTSDSQAGAHTPHHPLVSAPLFNFQTPPFNYKVKSSLICFPHSQNVWTRKKYLWKSVALKSKLSEIPNSRT